MPRSARLVLMAGLVLAPFSTWAGNPIQLTNTQLDHVTAGLAAVAGSANAVAAGVLALTNTEVVSKAIGTPSPVPANPAFGTSMAATIGTALAVGTDLGEQGGPPSGEGTSVSTEGAAFGTQVLTFSSNVTTHGAAGITFQQGFTVVYAGFGF